MINCLKKDQNLVREKLKIDFCFCEGTKNKSESDHFNALIKDLKFPGEKIELRNARRSIYYA